MGRLDAYTYGILITFSIVFGVFLLDFRFSFFCLWQLMAFERWSWLYIYLMEIFTGMEYAGKIHVQYYGIWSAVEGDA